MAQTDFHVLTVGWDPVVVRKLAAPLQEALGYRFSYIPDPSYERESLPKPPAGAKYWFLRDEHTTPLPPPDLQFLGELEGPGVPTIHNMIRGDRIVGWLDYQDGVAYASYLAHRFRRLYEEIRPSVVIGAFDGIHNGVAMAVARTMGVPWFAMHFSTIPTGMIGFCTTLNPGSVFTLRRMPDADLYALADRTLRDFETASFIVPAYLSANNLRSILKRLPSHARVFTRSVRRLIGGQFDKYTQYPVTRLAIDYVRKRRNLLMLPRKWMVDTPPSGPYVFLGLHMQPESSIDTWAPFYADQFAFIESIARATPPTHPLLVKLHKSDADNYSPRELARLRSFPGVRLVAPWANTRNFIENASAIVAIQGHIAMEAALLGKPVLLFGDVRFTEMPSVTKAGRVTDVPEQLRAKLAERPPDRDAIVRGLAAYAGHFAPGCYNDWDATPTAPEIENVAEHFRALRRYLEESRSAGRNLAEALR